MAYIILDLDNCISCDDWRIQAIAWQHADPMRRYHDYHMLAPFDPVGGPARSELVKEFRVIIFTGRPLMFRAPTLHWMQQVAGINPAHLLMRNNDDHRKSKEVKRSMLRDLIGLYNVRLGDIALALDDREDIVEMYREEGLKAEISRIHNVCAYTNPHTGIDKDLIV